ncbi:MAG: dTMP kinase [Candidatus Omnitrophica bacterium]|nr:dTMP kinase [Candidatus Omnitrophota bacterium]
MKRRHLFITFEGVEKSGKSTHIKNVEKFLLQRNLKVKSFREPGSTKIGEKIRRLLLTPENDMHPFTEFLLYAAARAQFVKEVLSKALKTYDVVLSDRFYDSTLVYQGYALGLGLKEIKPIVEFLSFYIKPDLTFILDSRPEETLAGARKKDRIERRSLEFHRRVRKGYLLLAKMEPERIKIIRRRSKEEVEKEIISYIERLI